MVRSVQSLAGVAVAAILLAPGVASPADGGEPITRDLNWRGGDSFGVSMSARVTFTQSPVSKIVVSGPREIVEQIVIDGDTVRMRDGHWRWNWNRYGPVTITASAPHVRASSSGLVRLLQRPASLNSQTSSSGSVKVG